MGKISFFFGTVSFNPWAILATMIHIGALQRIQGKWIYKPILNKNLPLACMESKFEVLGVTWKLVKYMVWCPKKIKN